MAVYMVEAESGFIADRVSPKNKNGTRDHLLFQFNSQYHSKFIKSNPTPEQQIEYGCSLYKQYKAKGLLANRWYGYRNIIMNPKAMNNVKNRFLITYE